MIQIDISIFVLDLSFERNKLNISQEIFSCIEHDLDNDGANWKDYEPGTS